MSDYKKKGKGVVYYYSIENIDYIEKKLNIITSLCNIPIKEICLNKSAGFLICLSQGKFSKYRKNKNKFSKF